MKKGKASDAKDDLKKEDLKPEQQENAEVQEEADGEQAEVENLEEEEGKVLLQIKELNDRYMRTLAEFDNFRKRTAKEKAGMYNDGVADTVEKLLPVIDNFERAVASAADKDDAFVKGVGMILTQMQNVLKGLNVEEIPAHGEPFDANLHYAVAHMDDPEHGENTVADVMQKGYQLNGRVIRPAMVKVAN